jgi:hypothetical protein
MFRFTIRDVLWVTALVAMGVGWWIDHGYQARRGQNAEDWALLMVAEAIDDFGGHTGAKWKLTPDQESRIQDLRSGKIEGFD